jgi:hypothetical protein
VAQRTGCGYSCSFWRRLSKYNQIKIEANQLGNLYPEANSDYTGYVSKNTPDHIADPNTWQPLRVSTSLRASHHRNPFSFRWQAGLGMRRAASGLSDHRQKIATSALLAVSSILRTRPFQYQISSKSTHFIPKFTGMEGYFLENLFLRRTKNKNNPMIPCGP